MPASGKLLGHTWMSGLEQFGGTFISSIAGQSGVLSLGCTFEAHSRELG